MNYKYKIIDRKLGREWVLEPTYDILSSLPCLRRHSYESLQEMANAMDSGNRDAIRALQPYREDICERWLAVKCVLDPEAEYTFNELNNMMEHWSRLADALMAACVWLRIDRKIYDPGSSFGKRLQRREASCGIQPKKAR